MMFIYEKETLFHILWSSVVMHILDIKRTVGMKSAWASEMEMQWSQRSKNNNPTKEPNSQDTTLQRSTVSTLALDYTTE